jgi:hypothetical protein
LQEIFVHGSLSLGAFAIDAHLCRINFSAILETVAKQFPVSMAAINPRSGNFPRLCLKILLGLLSVKTSSVPASFLFNILRSRDVRSGIHRRSESFRAGGVSRGPRGKPAAKPR